MIGSIVCQIIIAAIVGPQVRPLSFVEHFLHTKWLLRLFGEIVVLQFGQAKLFIAEQQMVGRDFASTAALVDWLDTVHRVS